MNISGLKRITCVVFAAMTVFSFASAQKSVEEQKKEINKIKKSSSYIYGEATLADKQAAIDLAKDILYQNVNEWVSKQKKFAGSSNVVTVNTNYAVEDMMLPRGNMFRAFMYVKKNDIIPANNVTVTDTPDMQVKTAAKPGVSTVTPIGNPKVDAVVSEIIKGENTGQLSAALTSPENYLMVIFTGEGNIQAVLSEGVGRTNMKTGKADAISNYKGCGAIGVKIKK